jgi:hypothetical protein
MADKKISALTAATTPLAGTEVLPIVQGGATVKVSVDNLTAGKPVSMSNLTYTGTLTGSTGILNIGAGQVYKDASGNVGIGVTPSAWRTSDRKNLQVDGGALSAGNAFSVLYANAYLDASAVSRYVYTGTASSYAQSSVGHVWSTAVSGTAGDAISFSERMRIDSSGNVGIGVTPAAGVRLDVRGSSAVVAQFVGNNANNYIQLSDNNGTNLCSVGAIAGGNFYTFTAGYSAFYTGSSEKMRITSGGDVGIGTVSPSGKLDVVGGRTFLAANSETFSLGVRYNSTTGAYYIGATNAAAPDLVFSQSGGSERMRIADNGIVTMSAYGAGAATFSAAGVISSVSDETWKVKDGVPTNPDEMLQKLEPGYWFYNEEKAPIFGADRQLGFYAQNVNAAIGDEAAPIPEEGKPWGYYDRSVLAVTVMSLKNALNTIKDLTARLEALEAK